MSVGMDELERLLKRYVSTGAAVVVVILGSGQGDAPAGAPDASATTVTATAAPTPTPTPTITPQATPTTPTTTPQRRTSTRRPTPTTTPPTTTTEADGPDGTRSTGSASTSGSDTTGPGDVGTATGATTAAAAHGWGEPTRSDEFDAGTDGWRLYDGPGHDGKGRHVPAAVAVEDGVLTITGDAEGNTGGMSWGRGQRYGRWEGRVRAPAADPSYTATLLLWPDAENWPVGGEIDVMELRDPTRLAADGHVHHGPDNRQVHGTVRTDATQWHNWAVDWTPTAITLYLDGREWYRTTDTTVQPPGPMHLCVQLDWFPKGGAAEPSTMQVDWVREYAAGGG